MGVLYGKYDLLDSLTAYRVRPAPQDPPGKFETGTGNFEGAYGALGALKYIEWVSMTFEAEPAERAWIFSKKYPVRLSTASLTVSDWRSACSLARLYWKENILVWYRKNWRKPTFTFGMRIIMSCRSLNAWSWRAAAVWCGWGRCITTKHRYLGAQSPYFGERRRRSSCFGGRWGGLTFLGKIPLNCALARPITWFQQLS
jgi:hypothetical protein